MLFNRIPVIHLLIAMLILIPCVLTFYPAGQTAESQLLRVREEAQRIVDAPERRSVFTERCIAKATPLFDTEGRIGSTAMLYYIAVAPIVGADLSIASIPPASEVFLIETLDLLLISELLFYTDRLGPAEQLVGVALDGGELRAATLELAIKIRTELGSDADVMQHTEEWAQLDPGNPKPYRIQAMVHRNHARWDNFIVSAERAVELTPPTDWMLQVELVDGYTHLGRIDAARRELDRIREARPDLIELAPVMHARLLLQEGDHDLAEDIIDRCLVDYGDDTEAMLMKGKLRIAKGDYAAAIALFEKVKLIDPADEQAYYQLGQAYARSGNKEAGQKSLDQHRRLLDAKIALYSLEQKAAREPRNAAVRRELAAAYSRIGLPQLAEFWMRAARASGDGA
jgi:tetratricopeptide (TPR) repeat protein